MNVSVPAMSRLAGLVVAIGLVAACGDDPSLQIEVKQPTDENYKRLITKTVVTVYESDLDTLTCEQIEFGDVTEDLLLGASVAQQTVFKDGRVDGTLDDISRLGKKVVVARMFTETDVLVAAGCAEQGDLDGKTKVVVETVLAASVAIDTQNTEDPYGKQITMLDPLGEATVGREVRWRVFSPFGATPSSLTNATVNATEPTTWDSTAPACTDNRGIARMRLTAPAKVAGFAARFRVSWPATPVDVISGFVRPGIGLQLIVDPPASNRCAVRTLGERRVVCLEETTTTPRAHRYEIAQLPQKNFTITDRGTANIAFRPAGAFSTDEAGGKEVYALLANGNVQNLFGTTSLTPSNCADCAIDDFRVTPACGDDPARIVVHSTMGNPLRSIPIHGGAVTDFGPAIEAGVTVNLNSVGCVTTVNAVGNEKDVQVIVLDLSSADGVITRGFYKCATGICNVTLPFPTSGVGFVKAGTVTKPEMQMVGTAFDIAGAELVAWILRPTPDGSTVLIDRRRIIAAAPPVQLVVGKLDGDSEPDLVWNMRGTRSSLLQVSYAHPIEDGSRLSALAPLPVQVAIEELALGDLTGDGFDDLIGITPGSFIVLPQNVDGPAVPDRTLESVCD